MVARRAASSSGEARRREGLGDCLARRGRRRLGRRFVSMFRPWHPRERRPRCSDGQLLRRRGRQCCGERALLVPRERHQRLRVIGIEHQREARIALGQCHGQRGGGDEADQQQAEHAERRRPPRMRGDGEAQVAQPGQARRARSVLRPGPVVAPLVLLPARKEQRHGLLRNRSKSRIQNEPPPLRRELPGKRDRERSIGFAALPGYRPFDAPLAGLVFAEPVFGPRAAPARRAARRRGRRVQAVIGRAGARRSSGPPRPASPGC